MKIFKMITAGLFLTILISPILSACSSTTTTPNSISPSHSQNTSLPELPGVNIPYVFAGAGHSGMYRREPTEVVVDTALPETPPELVVYQTGRPSVDEAYAEKIAYSLGFTDAVPLTGGERVAYSYTRGNQSLEIGLHGSIRLELQPQKISDSPSSLPSDQDCINIASDWLKSNDLYPDKATQVQVKYGGISVNKPGEAPVYYTKRVGFIIGLNDYECYSLTASVLVGEQGKIVQVETGLYRIKEYGLVKLKSPQAALDILQLEQARLTPITNLTECLFNTYCTKAVIKKISLRYSRSASGDYIQPIYVFEGEAYSGDKLQEESFIGRVDAIQR